VLVQVINAETEGTVYLPDFHDEVFMSRYFLRNRYLHV
jgi:hypothetical protein